MKTLICSLFLTFNLYAGSTPIIRVGSKPFTEGQILSEIIAQAIESTGEAQVVRKFGLGETKTIYNTLKNGEIDIYPEYTGAIEKDIAKNDMGNKSRKLLSKRIKRTLDRSKLISSRPFGFSNTNALVVRRDDPKFKNISTISDLKNISAYKSAFSHEFMSAQKGLFSLLYTYKINIRSKRKMKGHLLYDAIYRGEVDMIEAYSTDYKIEKYKLKALKDDKNFFDEFLPVMLVKNDFPKKYPASWKLLNKILVNKIDVTSMTKMNAQVTLEGLTYAQVAGQFLKKSGVSTTFNWWRQIYPKLIVHVEMVMISLILATIVGIGAGVLAIRYELFGKAILSISGLFQTIPSVLFLFLLIPFLGIGKPTAYLALFLYGLFPIVKSTYSGLKSQKDDGSDMKNFKKLFKVQLPLARHHILGGVKTTAIINVGTTTLAAFLGAGGLGDFIINGLSLKDQNMILMGAIPATVLAFLIHLIFDLSDKYMTTKKVNGI